MTEQDKVTVDDIIGIVKTEEQTNSVEEVRKLRGRGNETAKRFTITQDFEEHHRQIRDNGKIIMGCFLEPQAEPICNLLNELHEEKEQLLSDKEHLMGYLIRFCSFDDDDLDYVMNRESNREYGKQYYEMKEEDW